MTHHLLERIDRTEVLLSAVCLLGCPASLELAAAAGYDIVLVDGQHGEFDRSNMGDAIRALDSSGCVAMARPAGHEGHAIEWLLDIGYTALLIPMVNTPEQARAAVQAAYYPPIGQRSQAFSRASLRSGGTYRETANDEVMLVAMIETVEGLDNVEEISAVEGISMVFIGAADLASSMGGLPNQPKPSGFEEAVQKVFNVARSAGKPVGIACSNPEEARMRIQQGFQMLTLSSELRLLGEAHEHQVISVRGS